MKRAFVQPTEEKKTRRQCPRLMTPSDEQQCVLDEIGINNIVLTALPGSGKTTLALHIVNDHPKEKVIIVSYNASLAAETMERVAKYIDDPKRVKVVTYHALISSLCRQVCGDDTSFHLLANEMGDVYFEEWKFRDASILVVDEAQDVRAPYWTLLKFLITKVMLNAPAMKIVVCGDERQLLYDFYTRTPADSRFLTMADSIIQCDRPWKHMELRRSFRLTTPCTLFVNRLFGTAIVPKNNDAAAKVSLILCRLTTDLADEIYHMIRDYGDYDEILVLFTSTNQNSTAIPVVRRLASRNIPVHVTRSGSMNTSNSNPVKNVGFGKVKVGTYHSAKGIERKFVIVVNDRRLLEEDPKSNSLFVAMTRAKERMVVFQEAKSVYQSELFEFVELFDQEELEVTIKRHVMPGVRPESRPRQKTGLKTRYEADTMFMFLDAESVLELMDRVSAEKVNAGLWDDDDDEDEEDKKDADDLKVFNNFDHLSTIQISPNRFASVSDIICETLLLAISYELSSFNIPPRIHSVEKKICDKCDVQEKAFLTKAVDEIKVVLNTPKREHDTVETDVQRRFRAFALLALVEDVVDGYADIAYTITDVAFVTDPLVFDLYSHLRHNVFVACGIRPEGSEIKSDGGDHERAALRGFQIFFDETKQADIKMNIEGGKTKKVTVTGTVSVRVHRRLQQPVCILFTRKRQVTQECKLKAASLAFAHDVDYIHLIGVCSGDQYKIKTVGSKTDFITEALENRVGIGQTLTNEAFVAENSFQVRGHPLEAEYEYDDEFELGDDVNNL